MSEIINHFIKKNKNINHFFNIMNDLYGRVINDHDIQTEEDKIFDTIQSAHEEWENAELFFQNVSDPDLVDYAIYRLQAAKTKYDYLIKLARTMDLKRSFE